MKNKNKLIIYGNGSIAKLVYSYMQDDYDVIAFTVDEKCIGEDFLLGLPLIPFEEIESVYSPSDHKMIIAIGFVDMNVIREQRYHQAKRKGYSFVNCWHSSVIKHSSVKVGENNIILEHASIHPFSVLGNSIFISSNSNIGHDCIINDNCWINAGVSVAGETTIGGK